MLLSLSNYGITLTLKLPWLGFWLTSFWEAEHDTKWNDTVLQLQLLAHLPKASESDLLHLLSRAPTLLLASPLLSPGTGNFNWLHHSHLGKIPRLSWLTQHTLPSRKCPASGKANKNKWIPLVTPQAIAPWKAWTDCSPIPLPPHGGGLALYHADCWCSIPTKLALVSTSRSLFQWFHWRKASISACRGPQIYAV